MKISVTDFSVPIQASVFKFLYTPSGIIALKASGRDCTNNNELLHKIGVLQRYGMHLFLFTKEL